MPRNSESKAKSRRSITLRKSLATLGSSPGFSSAHGRVSTKAIWRAASYSCRVITDRPGSRSSTRIVCDRPRLECQRQRLKSDDAVSEASAKSIQDSGRASLCRCSDAVRPSRWVFVPRIHRKIPRPLDFASRDYRWTSVQAFRITDVMNHASYGVSSCHCAFSCPTSSRSSGQNRKLCGGPLDLTSCAVLGTWSSDFPRESTMWTFHQCTTDITIG